MKRFLLLSSFIAWTLFGFSQQIIISQYIEAIVNSTSKGIEIFNVSGADIVFSATNNLQVYKGTNGNPCSLDGVNITSGTLAENEVWVIGTANLITFSNANGINLSGTTTKSFNFNGDDALQVYLGGALQDNFGTCGSDPGLSWNGNGVSTKDQNIQLLDGICTTDGAWTDPSIRFSNIADGSTMTGFGNAPAPCSSLGPTISFTTLSSNISENSNTFDIQLESNMTGSHTADIVVSGGSANNGTEYTYSTQTVNFNASTSAIVTITLNDDANCVGNQNVVFQLSNLVNCTAGANNFHNLTIVDDEMTSGALNTLSFEGADSWNYVGGGSTNATFNKYFGTTSYRLGGSNNLTTDNIAIGGLNNITLSVAFASIGADSNEDLFLDISYDNGTTWNGAGSIKLVDGYSNANINMGNTSSSDPTTVATNPWIVNIPSSENQIKVRLRVSSSLENNEYYWIDDIILSGEACNTCIEPTTNSDFYIGTGSPNNLTSTSASLNWTVNGGGGGDGENAIVVMRAGGALVSMPTDNNTYSANSLFGTAGNTIGSNDYVIYNGPANSVDVTGLTPGTEYFTKVFDYNCLPGSENYLTVNPGTDAFITKPEPAENFITLCATDNTIEFSWAAPLTGNHSGYLLVARQDSDPSGVSLIDSYSQPFDLNFTAAPIYSAATNSKVLYRGTDNNVTVTGLTEGAFYRFFLYTYSNATTGFIEHRYTDTRRQLSATIDQMDVVGNVAGFAGDTQATVSWNLPPTICWDEILVMATQPGQNFIQNTPSGNGSAYTANPVFASNNQVVYKGTGNTVNVTNLTNNSLYGFEVFVRNGSEWSHGKEIFLYPSTATILEPGDLAIVAVNTSITSDGLDEVCFVSFKDINESTSIDFTDNGYERQNAGFWGGTEGTVRMQRTGGGIIPKGKPICFQGKGNSQGDFQIFKCGEVDVNWTISNLNGSSIYYFDSNGDDQIWIMQGGAWTGGDGSHNGQYSGNVLYGWTAVGWEPNPGYNDTKGSTLYPSSQCFTTNLTGVGSHDKVKYTGPTSDTSKLDWILRINDTDNWTGYSDNNAYNNGGPNYSGDCVTFGITTDVTTDGIWTGDHDENWFDCLNWSHLRVPDDSTNVIIPSPLTTTNFTVIDLNLPDAAQYGSIAKARNLTIEGPLTLAGASDNLVINQTLLLNATTSLLQNKMGGTVEVYNEFQSTSPFAVIDFSSAPPTPMSTFILHDNWIVSGNTNVNNGFIEANSQVIFKGGDIQLIQNNGAIETFHNLVIDKDSQVKLQIISDIQVNNTLSFASGGYIDSHTSNTQVVIESNASNAIIGHEAPNTTGNYINDNYVHGRLKRNVMPGITYDFPIGDRPSQGGLKYHPIELLVTNGSSGHVTADFSIDSPGFMNLFDNTQTCSGNQRILDYDAFSNDGYWQLTGPSSMTYSLTVHPNIVNPPLAPVNGEEYRLLRANSMYAGNLWPNTAAYENDICDSFSPYYATQAEFLGFSIFAIVADALDPAILPVELISFSAKVDENNVSIKWTTATEIDNDLFRLHHSLDGIHWEVIETQNGAGNSIETLNYAFLHKNASYGLHYYQLEQIDYNGDNSLSQIEVIEIGNKDDILIYPIPASDYLYIDVPNGIEKRTITIFNDHSQLLSQWTMEDNRLYIGDLPDGVYFLSITSLNANTVKKFIKVSGH